MALRSPPRRRRRPAASSPPPPPPSSPDDSAAPPSSGSASPAGSAATPGLPEGYVELVDDTGLITVVVPEAWADVDTAPVTNDDGSPRPWIAAAPDLDLFHETFDVPGVAYAAFPREADPLALIDRFGLTSGCESIDVEPYNDGVFVGVVQVGTACGTSAEATWNLLAASPAGGAFTALVQVQTASAADQDAADTVLSTFDHVPDGFGVPSSSVPGSSPGFLATDHPPVGVAPSR